MITASIVLYKTNIEDLKTVINSFKPSTEKRLFLIDNSPTAMESQLLSSIGNNIEYIYNNANLGYGAAHNIGIAKAIELNSVYHIILNPDISFDSNAINELIMYADKNLDVSYILPKVFYPNGELQYLCRHLPYVMDLFARRFGTKLPIMKKIDAKYSLHFFSYDKIINPPCLSGCFMFLRVKTLKDQSLLFDDRFFMYFEDFDLIRRLHKYGKTIFYPKVSIIHAHASQAHTSKKMFWIFIQSMCKYFNKWGWFFDKERKVWNRMVDLEIKEVDNK